MTTARARLLTAVMATMIFLLTGCVAAPSLTNTPTPTAAALNGLPAGVQPAPIPTDVPNDAEVRKQVQVSSCAGNDREWEAAGTITNTTKADKEYRVTVFFTTPDATVIDFAETTVQVHTGETAKWSASKSFATGGEILCVLRGVA